MLRKPGPRSKTQSIIVRDRGSLGDTTSSSDDTDAAATSASNKNKEKENRSPIAIPSKSQPQLRPRHSQFQSPDTDNNATDYGLEFTTSNIRNLSPRRCSTLRSTSSQDEQRKSGTARTRGTLIGQKETATTSAAMQEEKKRGRPRKQNINKAAKSQMQKKSVNDEADAGNRDEENRTLPAMKAVQQTAKVGHKKKQAESLQTQKKAGMQIRQTTERESSAEAEQEEEEQEEEQSVESSRRILKEANMPSVSHKAESNAKKSTTSKQNSKSDKQTHQASATKNTSGRQQAVTSDGPVKKPRKQKNPLQRERRFWREVKTLQNRTDLLVPRLPFSRLVREIMMAASMLVTQITPSALEALQTSTEMYVTQRLQDAYMLTLHRGRVTLEARDMELINYLKMNL